MRPVLCILALATLVWLATPARRPVASSGVAAKAAPGAGPQTHTIPAVRAVVQHDADDFQRARRSELAPWTAAIRERTLPPHLVERRRLKACAGQLDDDTHDRVSTILTRRLRRKDPGFDRFVVLGASASRDSSFLTGFGLKDGYSLGAGWGHLVHTIRWFSGWPRPHNSFRRKFATNSGSTAGNYVWPSKWCPDCPDQLKRELRRLRPAFAMVMFGTNNVSWGPMRGFEDAFHRKVAAGPDDLQCQSGDCLPAWEPGPVKYGTPKLRGKLKRYVTRTMAAKVTLFGQGFNRLLAALVDQDIVPVISTIPPMPRKWLDEDTVFAINTEIRKIARVRRLPLIDLWCALTPTLAGPHGSTILDRSHPIALNNKGIGADRYHPQERHAFDIRDETLVHGYAVRNALTLLRLDELRLLSIQLRQLAQADMRSTLQ